MNRFRWVILLAAAATLMGAQQAAYDEKIDYKTAAWQREIDGGFVPYHKLTIDDFQVRDSGESFDAFTQGFIHYEFRMRWRSDGGRATATFTSFDVRSGLDINKTWRKSKVNLSNDRLVQHEQGHLDINELAARELRKMKLEDLPNGTGSSGEIAMRDAETKVKQLVDDKIRNTQDRQDQYDRDTSHGAKSQAQSEWNSRLQKELNPS